VSVAVSAEQTNAVSSDRRNRIDTLCLGLLITTLWLATRPYFGVIHDSRLYTVQALSALLPGRFSEDLYLHYGSQDQFTLFTALYKPFLAVFGIAYGNSLLLLIAQLLWLTGLVHLARSLFRDGKTAVIAIAAAIALPGELVFRYGEPFLTPRLFAEALTFWALGSMLHGRPIRAVLLLCISMTLHPLMTMPGFAVLYLYEAAKRPVLWVLPAVIAIPAMALAFAGFQPFARILLRFDPTWLAVVRVRDYFCLVAEWRIHEWLPICNMLALAALGLRVAEPEERRFLSAAFVVALASLALSLIGGDVFHDVLIVDIQQWRATWLLSVVAHLFVGPILCRIKGRSGPSLANAGFLLAVTLGLLALSQFFPGMAIIAAPVMIVAWLVCGWEKESGRPISGGTRILVLVIVGGTLGLAILALRGVIASFPDEPAKFLQALIGPVLTVSVLTTLAFQLAGMDSRQKFNHPIPMLAASIALAAVGCFAWDQRSPWTKFVDSSGSPPQSLTAMLPGDAPIYWDGDVTATWFLLKRASYFSCLQGSGLLFYRATAIDYQHRVESFASLHPPDFGHDRMCPSAGDPPPSSSTHGSAEEAARRPAPAEDPRLSSVSKKSRGWSAFADHDRKPSDPSTSALVVISRADLSSVCKKEPGLGALVMTQAIEGLPQRSWVAPVDYPLHRPMEKKSKQYTTDRFFIYSCNDFR
jgi:hypothetical protein